MKACRKCSYKSHRNYCPKCGEPMREIAYESKDEIIVKKRGGKGFGLDNISGFGFHVMCCEGRCIVGKYRTTSGKIVYTCGCCGLRVVVEEPKK